jgi:hypothetical protein
MDAIELLGQLGQVEPAEQAVLDEALRKLALAARRDSGRDNGRARPRRQLVTVTAAAAVALAAVGTAAVVTGLGAGPLPRPAGAHQQGHPGPAPVTASGPPRGSSPRVPTVAAILTAFSASGGDILRVTKIVRSSGESTLRTVIWVWPANGGATGGTVRSRILTFDAGTRLNDVGLTYPATAPSPPQGQGCDIFLRPRIAYPPAAGVPGSLTVVTYGTHSWGRAAVAVQAANLPSAARLRACLKAGQWQSAGPGDIAGTRVTELTADSGELRLWVSAATDLPVRLRSGGPDGQPAITFTFAFLAPTRASLAMLTPPVPPGFVKRPI